MTEPILRIANLSDIIRIKDFINTNWKRFNLINNEDLFQFYFVRGNQVNFLLAEDENGTIYGTLGFIYCNNLDHPDLGATLFKTIASPYTLLGVRMFQALKRLTGCRFCFAPNIVPNTAQLHCMLGHTVSDLEHWYRLSRRDEYHIAVVNDPQIRPVRQGNCSLCLYRDYEELFQHFVPPLERIPYKDRDYLIRRYYQYPGYRYDVYGIKQYDASDLVGLLICREVAVQESRILKIVDFLGNSDLLPEISGELQRMIDENDYEYIEMYQFGIPGAIMESAGFTKRGVEDKNIIPTYLEPLAQVNTNYKLFYSNHMSSIQLFKADSDMDRPNIE